MKVLICSRWNNRRNTCKTEEWIDSSDLLGVSSLDLSDPSISQLISSVALVFTVAWIFNFLVKFILNNK